MKRVIINFTILLFVSIMSLSPVTSYSSSISHPFAFGNDGSNSIYYNKLERSIFVDFYEINELIILFVLVKDECVVFIDDTENFNQNSIYEFNIDELESGIYTIELITKSNTKIQKEIIIE